ncbi:ribonuclease P protein component 1 [Candidatus Pacearchaeota archaeon ex4484_26]|nr:MAG: ribonuclease P protein component 1 [Candidatus Pacearchaeota archaeon ex4484_26]
MKGILKEELIGLETEVIDAKNKSLIGIKGRIVNETKFTLHIRTAKGIKRVLKEQATFKLPYKNKKLSVEGKLLIGRPYERLKK